MKKVLKNKIILLLFILIYMSILLFLIINNYYLYMIVFIILSISVVIFAYKKLFNISLINFDKVKKNINYSKFNKNIDDDEIYSENMNISTFDGSNEFTHPSVLYFEKGFNGYKFWMAYTPYSNCNVSLENPCIAVSNDGINYKKPDKLINPLLPIIKNNNKNYIEYYNDPNLIFVDNKLELWYRLTWESNDKKTYKQKIFRMTSTNGINWEKPELIIDDIRNSKNLISISLLYEKDKYFMYYFDLNLKPILIKSFDLKKWDREQQIIINDYYGKFWHGEIKKIDNVYKFIFIDNSYNLYISSSNDGIHFNNTKKINIFCKSKNYFYFKNVLYKTSIVSDNKYYYIYVPFRFDKIKLFKVNNITYHKWITTITKIKKDNICKIMEEIV